MKANTEVASLNCLAERSIVLAMFRANFWSSSERQIKVAISKLADFVNRQPSLGGAGKANLNVSIRLVRNECQIWSEKNAS